MSETDVFTFLSGTKTPVGFILTWLVLFAVLSGTFSKAAENYGGIWGKASRALKRQKAQAIEADKLSIERKVKRLEESVNRLDKEIMALSRQNELYHDYSLYVLRYFHAMEEWAVTKSVVLPPPPLLSFTEFKACFEDNGAIPPFNFLDGD